MESGANLGKFVENFMDFHENLGKFPRILGEIYWDLREFGKRNLLGIEKN